MKTFNESYQSVVDAYHGDYLTIQDLDCLQSWHVKEITDAKQKIDCLYDALSDMCGQVQDLIEIDALESLEKEFETLKAELERGGATERYFVGFSLGVISELLKAIDPASIREGVESL